MTYLVAASKLDSAALNIAEKLIAKYGFRAVGRYAGWGEIYERDDVKLLYLDIDSVTVTSLERFSDVEAVVFASRHKSESGEPTLTVHAPGNLTAEARHGGRPRELAWAWPQRMRNALKKMMTRAEGTEYKVSLEATHHGPTSLTMPVWFVEIGGSDRYWCDSEAGMIAAEAIWASLKEPPEGRGCVGFGGGHYAPRHTAICLESDLAIGHIVPKYLLDLVTDAIIAEALSKTLGGCSAAVIDWKGFKGSQRSRILGALSKRGVVEVIKV
ncbi:MAG: D-aminoacyl-tRNA deacylase [Candidatus Bathyarchaeia archaeon]